MAGCNPRRRLSGVVARLRDEGRYVTSRRTQKAPPARACPECPNDEVVFGQKSADGAKIQRWFECWECGYESRSAIVYGPER